MSNTRHKTMLSEHFSKEELSYSWIAVENGLDNEPPSAACLALAYLAIHLLEPLRRLNNGPIAILSGYRSEAVNRLAGGVATSQHRNGEAVDCYIPEGPGRLLEILKKSGLLFDQAILYRKRKFLHISLKERGHNRMQVLFYMLLCLLILLPSCRIRQESVKKGQTFQTDSLFFSDKDSSFLNGRTYITDSINWNITRVVFSPPDSAGHQYPAEITLLQGNKYHNMIDTVSHTNNSLLELTHQQTNQSYFSENKEYNQSSSIRIWIISGILFAGGYVWWNIVSSRNFNK